MAPVEGESVPQEAERLLADMRDEYGIKGFPVAVYADGRRDDTCPWCHRTPEQGHDEDNCDWVAIDKALRLAEALLAECVSLRAERDHLSDCIGELMQAVGARTSERDQARDAIKTLEVFHAEELASLKAEQERLKAERDKAVEIIRELRRELAFAGVSGSPPGIPTLMDRLRSAESASQSLVERNAKLLREQADWSQRYHDEKEARESLVERVRGLEGYAAHTDNCAVDSWSRRGVWGKDAPRPDCTCGLDALLSSVSEQKEEQ